MLKAINILAVQFTVCDSFLSCIRIRIRSIFGSNLNEVEIRQSVGPLVIGHIVPEDVAYISVPYGDPVNTRELIRKCRVQKNCKVKGLDE